ncbi:MAG: MBL fold metallo-hydrolase [Candidatus Nanohaloarchaea archaeon]|nr:MBL fold metallo-hydrolase [Candidatus Nanohaloarchaea archaeon]
MRGSAMFGSVEVDWIDHATVKLKDSDGFTVYIDPWSDVMDGGEEKADLIISTHDHFDHFDKKAIQALKKRDTVLVCTEESGDEVPEDLSYKVIRPGTGVVSKGVRITGVPAYNVERFRSPGEPFHPEGFCTGVIFELDGVRFYHASDTDVIEEMEELGEEDIDVAFLPAGGTYTMDQEDAVEAVKRIKPRKVVPIHYGFIDETECDTEKFSEDVRRETGSEPVILEE